MDLRFDRVVVFRGPYRSITIGAQSPSVVQKGQNYLLYALTCLLTEIDCALIVVDLCALEDNDSVETRNQMKIHLKNLIVRKTRIP